MANVFRLLHNIVKLFHPDISCVENEEDDYDENESSGSDEEVTFESDDEMDVDFPYKNYLSVFGTHLISHFFRPSVLLSVRSLCGHIMIFGMYIYIYLGSLKIFFVLENVEFNTSNLEKLVQNAPISVMTCITLEQ